MCRTNGCEHCCSYSYLINKSNSVGGDLGGEQRCVAWQGTTAQSCALETPQSEHFDMISYSCNPALTQCVKACDKFVSNDATVKSESVLVKSESKIILLLLVALLYTEITVR